MQNFQPLTQSSVFHSIVLYLTNHFNQQLHVLQAVISRACSTLIQ